MIVLKPNLVIIGDLAYETTIINDKKYTGLGGSGYYSAIGAKASKNDDFLLISSVGKDYNFIYLDRLDIPKDGISIVSSKKTARFITKFINDTGKREFYADFGAIEFPCYEVICEYLDVPIVYLAGASPIRQLCWIKQLESVNFNGIIACDVFEKFCLENPNESIKVIEKCDIIFMNEIEKEILQYNPNGNNKINILKRGANGADIIDQFGNIIHIKPQLKCIAVDTNGAGDILAASFLSKIVYGYDYNVALQNAVDLATLSVTQEGAKHILV